MPAPRRLLALGLFGLGTLLIGFALGSDRAASALAGIFGTIAALVGGGLELRVMVTQNQFGTQGQGQTFAPESQAGGPGATVAGRDAQTTGERSVASIDGSATSISIGNVQGNVTIHTSPGPNPTLPADVASGTTVNPGRVVIPPLTGDTFREVVKVEDAKVTLAPPPKKDEPHSPS
jgi:hypothetical protein